MAPESSALKKGARVVVIDNLPGVAAGTAGRVGRAVGIKTVRYRVEFENGINALSVAESKLVSPAAWEFLKENQIAAPQAAPASSSTPAAPAVAIGAAPAPTTPPAPTPKAASSTPTPSPAAPPASSSGSAADDPRLAALTAKSREARKAAGVDVDAEIEAAAEAAPVSADETPPVAAADDTSEEPAAASPSEAASPEPEFEIPAGYFPPDNRVADLLASVRNG